MGLRENLERKIESVRAVATLADSVRTGSSTAAREAFGHFEAELRTSAGAVPAEAPPPSPPQGIDLDDYAVLGPELDLERNGSPSAGSVSDALFRLEWLMQRLPDGRRYFFRGQSNIDWDLHPSAYRQQGEGTVEAPRLLSTEERSGLADFRDRVLAGGTAVPPDDVARFSEIPPTHPDWLSLKQHYEGGTRLLDISSSFLEGLYFASVEADGTIDSSKFGVLFMFPETVRIMYDSITKGREEVEDVTPSSVEAMFDFSVQTPRMYFPSRPLRNERLRSQRGAFLWWPEAHEPYPGQCYYVRIAAESKTRIARELFRLGINPRSLLPGHGMDQAYGRLCTAIGVEERGYD